jgi:hypothetical protein
LSSVIVPRTRALPSFASWNRASSRQVDSLHGQSCSRAHFNTSRCPPSAALEQLSTHSTDSVAPTTTATHQCAELRAGGTRFSRPRAVVLPRPAAAPPGARPQPPPNTYSIHTGIVAPSPTAASPGARSERPSSTCSHPKESRYPAPTAALSRRPPSAAYSQVNSPTDARSWPWPKLAARQNQQTRRA